AGTLAMIFQTIGATRAGQTAAFTQTGGVNSGLPGPGGAVGATMLTVRSVAQGTPATYDLGGGRLVATIDNYDQFIHRGGTLDGSVTNRGTYAVAPPTGGGAAGEEPLVTGSFTNNGTVRVEGA